MNVPEVSKHTALESRPWRSSHDTLPKIKYVDHVTSYKDFFQNILLKNQLCIIGSEATADWTSRKNWVLSDGSPHLDYLLQHFGESVAPVADCQSEEFCAHPKTEMTVKEYLTYWQSYRSGDPVQSRRCLYLKDWHFVRDFPDYHAYQTPTVMCSDWMNEFWDVWQDQGNTDDYRFVYMGPAGSWTPFHADVLHSYSWSANVCGRKQWIFFPPGAENSLKDKHGHLVFDLRSADLQDSQKYPEGSAAAEAAITVIQNPGEIIFVPSGWHHEVFNLEDTISINHNWMNGCSAHLSWSYLKKRLLAVQKEIDDCRSMDGWHQQCQVLLKADSGLDYVDFYTFMACIARHRMIVLDKYIQAQKTTDPLNVSSSFTDSSLPALLDTEDLYQLAPNSFSSTSASCSDIPTCSYLCLFKGILVDAGERMCRNNGSGVNQSGGLWDDACNHQCCPHWAHTGPNLALFDLCRVQEIIQDMQNCEEFKIIMAEGHRRERISVPPAELVAQIESTIRQMKQSNPVTR